MPRLLLKFVVWFLKTLDYFGMLPTFLTDLSPLPWHGHLHVHGLAGIPPIVHHLYNFGNLPVFVAFGRKVPQGRARSAGKPVTRRYVDFVMNTDERIVDGFYYATVMKYFKAPARAGAARSSARGSPARYSLNPNIQSSCVCTACAGAFCVSVSRTAVCLRLK